MEGGAGDDLVEIIHVGGLEVHDVVGLVEGGREGGRERKGGREGE